MLEFFESEIGILPDPEEETTFQANLYPTANGLPPDWLRTGDRLDGAMLHYLHLMYYINLAEQGVDDREEVTPGGRARLAIWYREVDQELFNLGISADPQFLDGRFIKNIEFSWPPNTRSSERLGGCTILLPQIRRRER